MRRNIALLIFCAFSILSQAQREMGRSRQMAYPQYGGSRYPMKGNMLGFVGGLFLTSNPDMSGYDTKKNYIDGGGGLVYDYRNDVNENYTFEVLTSLMLSSCSTSQTEEGQSKMKFILPLDLRWYVGTADFKFFLGAGLQYNFIYSFKKVETGGYYYDYWGNYYSDSGYDYEEDTGAHQLSGNGAIGFSIFGMRSPVHILLGTKFHFPIINNAEGVEYSNDGRFDFSKDKTSITANFGISFSLGGKDKTTGMYESPMLMINYDYPLGSTKETSVEYADKRNFFETHSQSLTMSLLFSLGK